MVDVGERGGRLVIAGHGLGEISHVRFHPQCWLGDLVS